MAKDLITPIMKVNQFTLKRSKGKHIVWEHFSGATVTTSKTPSDHRALKNIQRDIKRELARVAS
jgi:predicted RNA binding protein YcfA (HicA-like mRNA interferase family)